MSHYRHCRRGYVLLVTLALLVLSTSLLVAVGRSAIHQALAARLEESSLQQRWGEMSCRQAILPYAERILVNREQQELHAVPECRATVVLGGELFTLVIADESAKANVNQIVERFGPQQAEDHIRSALTGTGLVNSVRLRPGLAGDDVSPPTTQQAGPWQFITGPGQLLDSITPDKLIESATPVMRELTFWGDGSLNLMRADQESMRLALAPAVTQLEISRLIAARDNVLRIPINSRPDTGSLLPSNSDAIGSLLSTAHIDMGKRNRLALTAKSTCHLLWIITNDGRKKKFALTVLDESNARQPLTRSLVW